MKLKPHEIHAALRVLVGRIEACGASPELTAASMLANDLRQAVGDRTNPANPYAASRVLDTIGPVDPAAEVPAVDVDLAAAMSELAESNRQLAEAQRIHAEALLEHAEAMDKGGEPETMD